MTLFLSIALAGCDISSLSLGSLLGGSSDMSNAKELFARVAQRDVSALLELEARAERNDLAAAFFAGLAHDPGVNEPGDPILAANFYLLAAKGFAGAKHNLALLILKGVDRGAGTKDFAIKLLSEAAAKDRLESMLMLATLYEQGWPGIDRNPALAVEWYERAVEFFKEPRAEAKLGAAYQEGVGRKANPVLAQTYLLAAAKAGIADAQYRLSRTVEDPIQIAQWLVVAALTDFNYELQARTYLLKLSAIDQEAVKRNAQLWSHAHLRKQDLVSYTKPLQEP